MHELIKVEWSSDRSGKGVMCWRRRLETENITEKLNLAMHDAFCKISALRLSLQFNGGTYPNDHDDSRTSIGVSGLKLALMTLVVHVSTHN